MRWAQSQGAIMAGYLLFIRERTLMARSFDAAKLHTTGDAIPICEQVVPLFPTLGLQSLSTLALSRLISWACRATLFTKVGRRSS